MKQIKNGFLLSGEVKPGKSYLEKIKYIKRLCIHFYGLGFLFATPKVRAVLIESVSEFIEQFINNCKGEDK